MKRNIRLSNIRLLNFRLIVAVPVLMALYHCHANVAQSTGDAKLDARVLKFLGEHRSKWRDLNVPYSDGKLLFELIRKNKFRNVLEIGTSTGHSSVWMAWALAGTNGTLTTIEIDEQRHREAMANFRRAGVASRIRALRGDAHVLVKKLPGPYDMVFSDADKGWYIKYHKILHPKLRRGGMFVAHNTSMTFLAGIPEFNAYIKTRKDYRTVFDRSSRSGMSISTKLK